MSGAQREATGRGNGSERPSTTSTERHSPGRVGGDRAFAPRVLLVEDDQNLRELSSEYLSGEGYRVEMAADGSEGLRRLGERRYDVVILDVNLPGLNGIEILETARSRGVRTPFVITTAEEGTEPVIRALRAGADEYLPKPVDPADLVKVVEGLVRAGRMPRLAAMASSGEELLLEEAQLEGWDLDRLEKEYLLSVLAATGGNRTRTAEILGIDRRTVYRKLKEYEREDREAADDAGAAAGDGRGGRR